MKTTFLEIDQARCKNHQCSKRHKCRRFIQYMSDPPTTVDGPEIQHFDERNCNNYLKK